MTFIHAYLLGGLVLAGVPILLHLILRQKPRRLPFPAFRFLRQRHLINQRKLRLQHLLLMALRVLVVAALCLALARPRAFSQRPGGQRTVDAVLVFDTSPSMEYEFGGRSRLDDAQARAGELLDLLSDDSRVAVLDSGDAADSGFVGKGEAKDRVSRLRIRPANGPLNSVIDRAARLFEQEAPAEASAPRFLYVFSDRTRACWDASKGRQPRPPEGVTALFIDVGVDKPQDVAIEKVEVDPPDVPPGGRYEVRVTVRGTGPDQEDELTCQVDPDPKRQVDRRPLRFAEGQPAEVVVFERTAPVLPPVADGAPADVPFQVTVKLRSKDARPLNHKRYATFLVRGRRRLLTVVQDDPRQARIWKAALEAVGSFRPEVKTVAEAARMEARDLAAYKVVCLFQAVNVPQELWPKLAGFVRGGGGLALVPAGNELGSEARDAYNAQAGRAGLLPATLQALASAPAGKSYQWATFTGEHPLMAPFLKWTRTADPDFARPELRPLVRRYWRVEPADEKNVIARYATPSRPPALLEKGLGKGRVVLFTTPLDDRQLVPGRAASPRWHNYWQDSSFGLVLADRVCRYLAGEEAAADANGLCGQAPAVTVPLPPAPPYTLHGAALSASEQNLPSPGEGGRLAPAPAQTTAPGNYSILDGKNRLVAGFSLNIAAEESDLSRVPAEEVEAAFGPGSLVAVGATDSLAEALQRLRPPPVELLPYLMVGLLVLLTAESLLANRFYRRPAPTPDEAAAAGAPVPELERATP